MVSFYFQIKEIRERDDIKPRFLPRGIWLPPIGDGSVVTSSQLYYFDENLPQIDPDPMRPRQYVWSTAHIPPWLMEFKTLSVYHDFNNFWAVDYDATLHTVDEEDRLDWNLVGFDHMNGKKNWVGLGGEYPRLGNQRNSPWVHLLFPEKQQPCKWSPVEKSGGLCGELPIIIALIAFSIEPAFVDLALEEVMQAGYWNGLHTYIPGRFDGRGMVVTVYLGPGTSSWDELKAFEETRIFPS